MALGSFEPVVSAREERSKIGRFVAGTVAGILLVVAAVAVVQQSSSVSLSAAKQSITPQDPHLAQLARDTDDRNGLQSLFKGMARQVKELKQAADYTEPVSAKKDRQPRAAREEQEGVAEAQVARMRRHEEAREMSPDEMVPWVKWPATAAAKARGAAVGQKRTKLLQTTELFQDNAAKVMPLKEIEERLAVDHKLHRGFVSDTQLAAADAAARKKSAKFEGKRTKLLQTTELFQDNAAKVMPLKEIEERLAVDHKLHRGFVSDTQLAAADAAARKKSAKFGEKKARSGSDGGLACDPFC